MAKVFANRPAPRPLELLAPAANAEIAMQAILHGADAVYIGPPSHGARKSASNSIEDIKRVVDFAHIYRAKVYVTVNTIIYDNELSRVEAMIWELWRVGVDALIVQDWAILRMNLPPIPLHASTQCDNRSLQKALFMESVGFSQIVLARELTLSEISEITSRLTIPVECFIHGALCVSYSGRCHASFCESGRSANRGECAQLCRLPWTLTDSAGHTPVRGKHLLSLRDFNLSDSIEDLAEVGVSSFKIEGRLKGASYVKNVTAAYSLILNRLIEKYPERYCRASVGRAVVSFNPDLSKSFNRGFTTYFLQNRRPSHISEPRTPKSLGEPIHNLRLLTPGDGIGWFGRDGSYDGMAVNRLDGNRVYGPQGKKLPDGVEVRRTYDHRFEAALDGESAVRKIAVDISVDDSGVNAEDERGVRVRIPLEGRRDKAKKPMDLQNIFAKLGNTVYHLRNFSSSLNREVFIPASDLTKVKRNLVESLDLANLASLPLERRRKEDMEAKYPLRQLDFRENVANELSARFLREHGVEEIEPAIEVSRLQKKGVRVMTTRHCVLREMGMCKREFPGKAAATLKEPLFIESGRVRLRLSFDCNLCEMQVFEV